MRTEGFGGAVGLSRLFLERRVRAGDRVIDATCGRGRDTLFLARLVGSNGRVWAFDIQDEALAETRCLLQESGFLSRVELVRAGHESLVDYVREPVRAVVFNLGYLPGNEAGAVTGPGTTLIALDQAVSLLLPGGLIAVAVYVGHPGGKEESSAVEEWASALSSREFNTWKCCQVNRAASAPYVLLVEKFR